MEELLRVNQLRVEFGDLVALRNVSFAMSSGDLLGLIGPNGAGKTTLLRVLVGLQPTSAGSATIMGEDVFSNNEAVRGRVAFAPDAPPAYEELTVEEFLRFIADTHGIDGSEASERIDHWLEQVWLSDRRSHRIRSLSRGMRQRVTIAQTLLPNPVVILLDEPSSGLDPGGRIQLRQVIASLRDQGKAVIVSSHILADLEEYCTHIAIIEQGRILRYSNVTDLHGSDKDSCCYRLTCLGTQNITDSILAIDGITDVRLNNNTYLFNYRRGEHEAAELLKLLLERGIDVTSFAPLKATLEEVYLQTGVKQVD